MRIFKSIISCLSLVTLVACGGGGSGIANNPLQKYEGTYYVCDGRAKETVTVTASGSTSVSLSYVEDTYQNNNCSGSIIGTYKLPQAITATFDSPVTASFPKVTILPTTATVDKVALSVPAMTAQLTGSGVSGRCITYTGGSSCYDTLVVPLFNGAGALYITGNYLVIFSNNNGVLTADSIHSKDPSFNINQLVPRP